MAKSTDIKLVNSEDSNGQGNKKEPPEKDKGLIESCTLTKRKKGKI